MLSDVISASVNRPRNRSISRIKLGWAACLLFIVVSLVVLSRYFSSKPDGVYYDPHLGSVGNAYWVFRAGQVHLSNSGPSHLSGSYLKKGDDWVSEDGGTVFKPSLLGLRMIDRNNSGNDRFLFRRGAGWLADVRDFIHDRLK